MTDGFSSTFNIPLRRRSVKASARKKTRRGPRPPPGAKKVGNRACFFSAARYSICCLQRRPQSCGVMVAQVILVHFVEVRILAGLPFFMAERRPRNVAPASLGGLDRGGERQPRNVAPASPERFVPVSRFSSPCTLFCVPNGSINGKYTERNIPLRFSSRSHRRAALLTWPDRAVYYEGERRRRSLADHRNRTGTRLWFP